MRAGEQELSDFWDIEAILPAKKKKPVPPSAPSPDVVDVISEVMEDGTAGDAKITTVSLSRPERKQSPAEAHYCDEDSLIREVTIYPWKTDFDAYRRFRRDAGKLAGIQGQPAPTTSFFSFVPQYSQMNNRQMDTYLWWREQVRNGGTPDVDFSYLQLYLFELLNLSEEMGTEKFFSALLFVWFGYRQVYHQLDRMLSEWIADYCLIHRVRPPEELAPILSQIEKVCSLKEVFLPGDETDNALFCRALLTFCSGYDYRTSRYATGETLEKMNRHIPGAVQFLLGTQEGEFLKKTPVEVTAEREAYAHAVCAAELKKKLKIRYLSLSQSYELRYYMTEIVKYAENRVRAACGIKSRLTAKHLPDGIREEIDAYFARELPVVTPSRKAEPTEEAYWKLYDAVPSPLSVHHAEEIESASWKTTERLVEAFEKSPEILPEVPAPEEIPENGDLPGKKELRYLEALLSGDVVLARGVAASLSEPEDALVDRINAYASEKIGDILLEMTDTGYHVIPDYREFAEDLIHD